MNSWNGDLEDDCSLERYGMLAHVERMDKGCWWFAISATPWVKGQGDLYNTADNQTAVRLTTGKMARAAAECCLELLDSLRPNAEIRGASRLHGEASLSNDVLGADAPERN